jgi:uncharacterized protein YdaU (DUF1376 family)
MTSLAWFPIYPTDFLADTYHLGNTELGIYWRLLLVYYQHRTPLPMDVDRLRRLAQCQSPEEQKLLEGVMAEYFTLLPSADGTSVWHQRRADQEIEKGTVAHQNKVAGAAKARQIRAEKLSKINACSDVNSDIRVDTKLDTKGTTTTTTTTTKVLREAEPNVSRSAQAAAPARRGTRLPSDWQPDEEDRAYAHQRGIDVFVGAEAENFRDYWTAAAGPTSVKRDWHAAWRTWCRRAAERKPARGRSGDVFEGAI